jgi:prepilin-type processing-associated H-X9-DG protein
LVIVREPRSLGVKITLPRAHPSQFSSQIALAPVMLSGFRRSENFFMKPSRNHRDWAFTLVELLLVLAVLVVLAALFLPSLARTKDVAQRINCNNNLKQIGLAFRTWALDNKEKYPMQVPVTNGGTLELVESGTVFRHFQVMSNELSTPRVLFCAEEIDSARGSANSFGGVGSAAAGCFPFTNDNQVSYFVGVDADSDRPSRFLSGDRNLAFDAIAAKPGLYSVWTNTLMAWVQPRHHNGGNICFADGSVQEVKTRGLRAVLIGTGMATNRLAMP